MDRGVLNNHKAEIFCSLKELPELVLKPGVNRVTPDQYRALREVPVINNYFEAGLLVDTRLVDEPTDPAPEAETKAPEPKPTEPKPQEKPLDRMNKEELTARATELGLTVDDAMTKAELFKNIQTALASA